MNNIEHYFKIVASDESNALFLMNFRGINISEYITAEDVTSAFKKIEEKSFGNHFRNNAKQSALAVIKQINFDEESKYDNWEGSYLIRARLSHHHNGTNFASILKGADILSALKSENNDILNLTAKELLCLI